MIAEQFSLDLNGESIETMLQDQWRCNMEAQAAQWTTENMARHWAGFSDEQWAGLPRYKKASIISLYEYEQVLLEKEIAAWQPYAEVFHPGGRITQFPARPFRIRAFAEVDIRIEQAQIDDHWKRAQTMADALAADWSANRTASVFTYDPILASSVSLILGRKVEAILPECPEERAGLPLSWLLLHALNQKKGGAL